MSTRNDQIAASNQQTDEIRQLPTNSSANISNGIDTSAATGSSNRQTDDCTNLTRNSVSSANISNGIDTIVDTASSNKQPASPSPQVSTPYRVPRYPVLPTFGEWLSSLTVNNTNLPGGPSHQRPTTSTYDPLAVRGSPMDRQQIDRILQVPVLLPPQPIRHNLPPIPRMIVSRRIKVVSNKVDPNQQMNPFLQPPLTSYFPRMTNYGCDPHRNAENSLNQLWEPSVGINPQQSSIREIPRTMSSTPVKVKTKKGIPDHQIAGPSKQQQPSSVQRPSSSVFRPMYRYSSDSSDDAVPVLKLNKPFQVVKNLPPSPIQIDSDSTDDDLPLSTLPPSPIQIDSDSTDDDLPLSTLKKSIDTVQTKLSIPIALNVNRKRPSTNVNIEPKPKKPKSKTQKKPVAKKKKKKKPPGKTTRFNRVKGVKPEGQESQVNFTSVKLTLKTILNEQQAKVQQVISDLSIKAARIASLASMLILAKVNDNLADFNFFRLDPEKLVADCFYEVLDPFKHVQGKRRTQIYQQYFSHAFSNAMAAHGIIRPNNDGMGNMFKYMYQMYSTNFKTNITTHARNRVFKLFQTLNDPNVTRNHKKSTVNFLFNPESNRQPSDILIQTLANLDVNGRYNYQWNRGCLACVENGSDWFVYVPLFILIQRAVHNYNMAHAAEWQQEDEEAKQNRKIKKEKSKHTRVRPMIIIPQHKYYRQHLRIDVDGLYRIVAALKLLPKMSNNPNRNIDGNEFKRRQDEFWSTYLNMSKIEEICGRANNKINFHKQIQSDGVSASLLYLAPIPKESDNNVRVKTIAKNYENGAYKYQVPIDFGYNTYIAAVRRNIETETEVNIKLKSKTFHRRTGFKYRNKRRNRLAGNYETDAANHRNSFAQPPSPGNVNYWVYINHRLQFWQRGIATYTVQEYAQLAFTKYTNTQSTIDKIVHKLTNKQSSLLLIGGAEFQANSPIKGHLRCPVVRKIVKAIKKYPKCDYLFVDEYNTSQHCGVCCQRFIDQPKGARYKVCLECTPNQIFAPSTKIISTKSKRHLKVERRDFRANNVNDIVNRIKTYNKNVNNIFRTKNRTTWQRDISAARLIAHKAVNTLIGQQVHVNLLRPNNTNYEDMEEDLFDDQLPPSIIW